MVNEYIEHTSIVLPHQHFVDTIQEWISKINAGQKSNQGLYESITSEIDKTIRKVEKSQTKLTTGLEKMEQTVAQFNKFFEDDEERNCSFCPIHCLPVIDSKVKRPSGRPTN